MFGFLVVLLWIGAIGCTIYYGTAASMLLWIPLIVNIAWYSVSRQKRKEAFQALPKEGPMKVNITTEDTKATVFTKGYKKSMVIDVTISQADWKSIAQAGLMKKVIFQYPGVSKDPYDPENRWDFRVEALKQKSRIDFGDTVQLEEAKASLIQGLHDLKSHIEGQKEGPQKESFEI
jgi:hypothetical protein